MNSPSTRPWLRLTARILVGVAGAMCVLVAVFARALGLDSSAGIGTGEFLLAATGLLLVAVACLGRRTIAAYNGGAVILLNTLVLLLVLELGATILSVWQATPARKGGWPVDYAELPYYRGVPWGRALWEETLSSATLRYRPYRIWQNSALDGQTLSTDENLRRTTPGSDCSASARRAFLFGGSTMWGFGSPDWGTIPAHLQRWLNEESIDKVCVVNFGVSAYVSRQSLEVLEDVLIAGDVPDIVIFYDGLNDIYAAYQSGEAGTHQNVGQIRDRYERPRPGVSEFLQHSALVRLIRESVSGRARGRTFADIGIPTRSLAEDVVQNYMGIMELVNSLSERFGFEAHFFWQPAITTSAKVRTTHEDELLASMDPDLRLLQEDTYRLMGAEATRLEHLHNLAGAFDGREEMLWIDADGHTTPEGNDVIAHEMLRRSDIR